MMFWFQLAVVVLLLIAVGWVAVGGGGHMSPPVPDRPDPAIPDSGLLERGDVDKVRFSVGARGYRMDEVDDVLDRLAYEIDVRERRIAELEGRDVEGPELEGRDVEGPELEGREVAGEPEPAPSALQQSAESGSEEPGQSGQSGQAGEA